MSPPCPSPGAMLCDCGYNFTTGRAGYPGRSPRVPGPFERQATGFFSFNTMIAPTVIKALYFLGTIGLSVRGVLLVVLAFEGGWERGTTGGPLISVLTGVGLITVGNVLWRLFCETGIVLFQIGDSLRSVERLLSWRPGAS